MLLTASAHMRLRLPTWYMHKNASTRVPAGKSGGQSCWLVYLEGKDVILDSKQRQSIIMQGVILLVFQCLLFVFVASFLSLFEVGAFIHMWHAF